MTPFTTPNCRDGIPAVIKKNNYQLHGANVYEYTQFEKESICKCWGSVSLSKSHHAFILGTNLQ